MEKKKSPSEVLAGKYADIFVEMFDRIPGHPQDPFLAPSPYPQQNISGNVYSGRNGFLTSLVASAKGYEFPLWLTFNQIKELGLNVNAGEHGVPVAVFRTAVHDRSTGDKVDMTEEEYRNLPPEDRQKYEVRTFLRAPWSVFNLSQTNIRETKPELYEQLKSMLKGPEQKSVSEELVDSMVSQDLWHCPIRINSNFLQPYYSFDKDLIASPPKEAFIDNSAYYSSMLYMMSQSCFHESRIDPARKGILNSDGMLRLASQLSSAMLCSLLGVTSRIDHDNLAYIKMWSQGISKDPMVIYKAVSDACHASNIVGRELGLGIRKGVDFTGVLGMAEKALDDAKQSRKTRKTSGKSQIKLRRK